MGALTGGGGVWKKRKGSLFWMSSERAVIEK